MKLFKKNQVIIYVIALMLVTAGYLNYTSNDNLKSAIQTSSSEEELAEMANIGDAQLVSSNDIKTENKTEENKIEENKIETDNGTAINTTNETKNENNTMTTSANNTKDNSDYFTNSKLERDTMYSQMIETYEKVINSSNASETQKQSATQEITKINNIKNRS